MGDLFNLDLLTLKWKNVYASKNDNDSHIRLYRSECGIHILLQNVVLDINETDPLEQTVFRGNVFIFRNDRDRLIYEDDSENSEFIGPDDVVEFLVEELDSLN